MLARRQVAKAGCLNIQKRLLARISTFACVGKPTLTCLSPADFRAMTQCVSRAGLRLYMQDAGRCRASGTTNPSPLAPLFVHNLH
jgi:hypothetical protein